MSGTAGSDRRVLISGSGVVAPEPLRSVFAASGADRGGASPSSCPGDGARIEPPEITAFETPEGAPTWGFEALEFRLSDYISSIKGYIDRCSALALGAARLALDGSGLKAGPGCSDIGLCYATTFGCLDSMELFWARTKGGNPKFAPPLPFTHAYANSPSSILAIEFGLRGHSMTFSGDVSSGLLAASHASDAIRGGKSGAILAGASEALSAPRWRHHWAEDELSADGRWAPLEEAGSKAGTVPGEGAAFLVLESAAHVAGRGARPESEAAGWGLVPFGVSRGPAAALEAACREALAEAGAGPADVSIVFLASPSAGGLAGTEREAMSKLFAGAGMPPACAPKWAGGDALSVSPLWSLAMASGCLAGRLRPWPAVDAAGRLAPPMAFPEPPRIALVSMLDPWGQAGAAVLRAV
ncbi:MAG: hypothetical protein N3A38_10400 [Planctomycetota bacterium]|nr:hypothetical protein [Planctomycetota bacterium]